MTRHTTRIARSQFMRFPPHWIMDIYTCMSIYHYLGVNRLLVIRGCIFPCYKDAIDVKPHPQNRQMNRTIYKQEITTRVQRNLSHTSTEGSFKSGQYFLVLISRNSQKDSPFRTPKYLYSACLARR